MNSGIELKRLTIENFADFERLTAAEAHGGCYCSFWHQKWGSVAEWEKCKRETPDTNRSIVLEKVKSGFHVGALAYRGGELVGWVSVGPLIDFHWTWRRVAQIGESARSVAGVLCITLAEKFRGLGLQREVLQVLEGYARTQGWTGIEGYPFDASAIAKHGKDVHWPGLTQGFLDAGFTRVGAHWLSRPEAERSIFSLHVAAASADRRTA